MILEVGQIYQHYNTHGLYQVIAIAKDTDTLKDHVIYQDIENGKIWTRSRSNFTELLGDGDEGTVYYRFSQVQVSIVLWRALLDSFAVGESRNIALFTIIKEANNKGVSDIIDRTFALFELIKDAKVFIRDRGVDVHFRDYENDISKHPTLTFEVKQNAVPTA